MTSTTAPEVEYQVRLRWLHERQREFVASGAKRKVVRAGRRGGKTVGASDLAVETFLDGKRVLYATPTREQIAKFLWECKRALAQPIDAGVFDKNETMHTIELPGSEQRLKAKTAWNADTLRGDYADLLILDEWQLMDEDTWELVGAPMLLDNDGDAVFIYTPPSLRSRSVTKSKDPRHASKMFDAAQADKTGRWKAFHFTSHDNPFISEEALANIARDMTQLDIRQEIEAEDIDEVQGALWTRLLLDRTRVRAIPAGVSIVRIVIGVDPPGGATECGISVCGLGSDVHLYVLADYSLKGTPDQWAGKVLDAYTLHEADAVVGEANYGGDMVESTIMTAAKSRGVYLRYMPVHATRGKAVRAEPQVARFERNEAHLVGEFPLLEGELTLWVPGSGGHSPNRFDAMVWALTELGGLSAIGPSEVALEREPVRVGHIGRRPFEDMRMWR